MYELKSNFAPGNRGTIDRARAFQFATIIPQDSRDQRAYSPTTRTGDQRTGDMVRPRSYILDSADQPGTDPVIAMELNNGFWIVTDLKKWQQYRRYSPGPLADGTGGVLLQVGAVQLNSVDLEFIKAELTKWQS